MSYNAMDAEQRMADWANKVRQLPLGDLVADCNTYHKEYHTVWKPRIRQLPPMLGFTELQYRHMETLSALISMAESNNSKAVYSEVDQAFVDGIRAGLKRGLIYGGIAASLGWFVVRHLVE